MSYEIIKSIKVRDNKVFIKGASNNVYPKDWDEWECVSLTKILQEKGQEELDLEILKAYEGGSFQKGNNKYTRALKVLKHFPEYRDFDWRGDGLNDGPNHERRKTPAFTDLLKRALRTYLPKDKFILTKEDYGRQVYLYKLTKYHAKWTDDKQKAKIFHYKVDAENLKTCFTNGKNWEVEKIK